MHCFITFNSMTLLQVHLQFTNCNSLHNTINSILGDGPECYTMENGADYRGNVATDQDGDSCMKWNTLSLYPRISTESHPDKGLGEHNHCRNPEGGSRAWCYTTHAATGSEWQYCNIGQPNASCIGRCVLLFCASNCL